MTKDQKVTWKQQHRPLEELNLMDDFLFQEMLQQEDGEEFCRILLGTILGRPIRKVRIMPQKNILGIDTARRGIRMDAYIEDISDVDNPSELVDAEIMPDIYDVEPNNRYEKQTLPKRMRYYHGLIDTQLLASGVDYDRLRNVVIIVILPYDPFGKNRMVYTIQNQCLEDASVSYEDGAKKIFLYTKGTEGNPSQELRDMLNYMERTSADNVTNRDIEAVHQLVKRVKNRKEVGINYMKSWELEKMWREDGREEGREEGLQQGREEGLQQGLQALIKTCQNLKIPKEEMMSQMIQNFSIPQEEAEAYIREYWK